MRILFLTRADAFDNRGGDTVQLEKLAEELRNRGHTITIATGTRFPEAVGFDVVHIFNMQRIGETAAQVRRCRPQALAISPIYADTSPLDRDGRSLRRRVLARLTPEPVVEIGKHVRRVIAGVGQTDSVVPLLTKTPARLRAWTLRQCRAILPNSQWERTWLEGLLGSSESDRFTVVPNGVDATLRERGLSAGEFRSRFGIHEERFLLSVARFDERKNNLRLIQAAKAKRLPCVLIGRPAPLHIRYFEQCRRVAEGSRVQIIAEHLSQEELAGAYRAAWVHALPSWLETPGLSSLEAGLFGANIVAGECPAVREYLGGDAWYCRPGDVDDIGTALKSAFEAERNAFQLDVTVSTKFNWSIIAVLQERVYGDIR